MLEHVRISHSHNTALIHRIPRFVFCKQVISPGLLTGINQMPWEAIPGSGDLDILDLAVKQSAKWAELTPGGMSCNTFQKG